MPFSESFQTGRDDEGRRLDRVIRKAFPALSLSWIYGAIRKGKIRLNRKRARPSFKIELGDVISIKSAFPLPPLHSPSRAAPGNSTASGPLEAMVLYRNRYIVAINKPRGLLTHGKESLDRMVKSEPRIPGEASLSFKPGPVHRLDRNTSGLIIFSSSILGARRLSAVLQESKALKLYLALLDGEDLKEETWSDYLSRDREKRLSGKARAETGGYAETLLIPLQSADGFTLALFRLFTGRTHQIRVQSSIHEHPLTGDRKYGGSSRLDHYLLHSACFSYREMEAELGISSLIAPLPEESRSIIDSRLGEGAAREAMKAVHRYSSEGL